MRKIERSHAFITRPALVDVDGMMPDNFALESYVCSKYGSPSDMGESPRLRYGKRYVAADDVYEALITKLITASTRWLDVGCGRDLFPSNREGARQIAARAACLVGVDPDENIRENDLLTDCFQGAIEDFESPEPFTLVTLRMVAEHVLEPERCVENLARLTTAGGLVVIYTPWKWAPMSLAASIVPFAWHNRLKRLIWDSEPQDTFPTAYYMNTRRDLIDLFTKFGFSESLFSQIDDCSVLTRYRWLNYIEITIRNVFCRLNIVYPEYCVLAAFRRL